MRRFLLVFIIGVAIVGIGVFFVDRVVASVIETGIEEGLGVDSQVGSVRLGLLGGTFSLSELRIANPPGFQEPRFLRIGHADTAVSFASLRGNEVVIPHLTLEDIEVTLEWDGRKRNVDVLVANATSGAPSEPSPDGRTFVIEELILRDVKAHLVLANSWAKVPDQHLTIPELKLRNVGRASGGVQLAEIAQLIVIEVMAGVTREGPQQFVRGLTGAFESLRATGAEGAPAEEIAKSAGKILEGLFGGGQEDR